jgi:hypothetical protein
MRALKLTDETFTLFEQLTRRPLLVVDTEFSLDEVGEHLISIERPARRHRPAAHRP